MFLRRCPDFGFSSASTATKAGESESKTASHREQINDIKITRINDVMIKNMRL